MTIAVLTLSYLIVWLITYLFCSLFGLFYKVELSNYQVGMIALLAYYIGAYIATNI